VGASEPSTTRTIVDNCAYLPIASPCRKANCVHPPPNHEPTETMLPNMSASDVALEGIHSTVVVRRPAARVIVLSIDGADVGELGERPFLELARDLDAPGTLQLFVDARDAIGPSIDVSGRWARFLTENKDRFAHVTMLTGSRFVRITASMVRDFSG